MIAMTYRLRNNMRLLLLTLLLLIGNNSIQAQDGKALYNQHCKSCHKPDKKSIGPPLRNVRTKWEEKVSDPTLIFTWVRNWQQAVRSGDPYVSELPNTYPGAMNPFDLQDEQITSILDYIDTYDEASENNASTTSGDGNIGPRGEIVITPNYYQNLNILIILIIVGVILFVAMLALQGSIRAIANNQIYIKNQRKKNKDDINKIVGVLLLIFVPAITFGQEIPADHPMNETFFKITETHIWIAVFIDLALLGIVLYFKSVLTHMIASTGSKPIKILLYRKRKINWKNYFTRTVAIEKEKDILMDHEYDGIQELDNVLPPWWIWMFFMTIVFGVIFIFHYHIFKTGDLQYVAYEKEMLRSQAEVDAYLESQAMNISASDVVQLTDPTSIAQGKKLYMQECIKCHGDRGQGGAGANLTDNYWIYGNQIGDVFNTISEGGNNGMEAWNSRYNPKEIQLLASFVLSIDYTVGVDDGGKAPEEHSKLIIPVDSSSLNSITSSDSAEISLPDTTMIDSSRFE